MVVVPAGSFTMGSRPAEEVAIEREREDELRVRIAEPFAVGRFAVTRGEFAAFIAATDHKIRASAIASRAHDGSARRAQTGARRVSHRTTATPLHA
jgi:formylglycine-generating enzyme required for sulfatase activity